MARWGVAALVLAAVAGLAAIQGTPRFAYVNSELILRQTPGFAQAESTWNAEIVGFQQEIQTLSQQFDSALAAYQQQSIMLTPTARQEREQELGNLQSQLDQRQRELQARADERQRALIGPLEDRVQRVIDGIRAERNLAVVFDVAAPGNNIISADPAIDLSAEIIRRLTSAGGS